MLVYSFVKRIFIDYTPNFNDLSFLSVVKIYYNIEKSNIYPKLISSICESIKAPFMFSTL